MELQGKEYAMKSVKKANRIFIGISAAMLVLGICLVLWPKISAAVLCYVLGTIMLLAGIIRVACYIQRESWEVNYYYELPFGVVEIFVAVILYLRPQNAAIIIPTVIGIMVSFNSIFKLQFAMDLKRACVNKWWGMIVFSIVGIVHGFLLMLNPFRGSATLMILLGLSLIVNSIENICTIMNDAKKTRKETPVREDYIDVDYIEIK